MPEYKSPQNEPGMDKNLLLIFLVMAVVMIGAQFFMRKYAPPPPSPAKTEQPVSSGPPSTQPVSPATLSPATSAQKASGAKNATPSQHVSIQATSESEIVIENDLYKITFTNRGAQVKSWILKKFNDDQGKPLDLVNSAAAVKYGYPLSLWTYDEGVRNTLNSVLYVPSSTEARLQAPAQISFDYSDSSVTVHKTFRFDHSYVVAVETSVFANDSPVSAYPAWPSGFGDQTTLPSYASGQFEYQVNSNTEHTPAGKISGGNTLHGTFDWVGASSAYFGAVFIPDNPNDVATVTLRNSMAMVPDASKPNETKSVDVVGVAVGRPGKFSARLFAGPKALEVLQSVPVPAISDADKDLRSVLNFGWWGAIARPLFALPYIGLRWFHGFTQNWGWAIVLQTFIITLAMTPLRVYQMKSALKMQKVQPEMKAIQEKYKKYSMKDPRKQEMNQEIAALYKTHKVNPVGGCLPLLAQMPFFIAYYKMLSAAIELRQAHWLWIHDLSASEPFPFLLPIIMVVSMFVSQKMTPQAGMDPAQQKMMTVMMPVMMGIFFFRLPAGLNLYYAESNLIMIALQAIMNRTELGREMRELAAKRARKRDK